MCPCISRLGKAQKSANGLVQAHPIPPLSSRPRSWIFPIRARPKGKGEGEKKKGKNPLAGLKAKIVLIWKNTSRGFCFPAPARGFLGWDSPVAWPPLERLEYFGGSAENSIMSAPSFASHPWLQDLEQPTLFPDFWGDFPSFFKKIVEWFGSFQPNFQRLL